MQYSDNVTSPSVPWRALREMSVGDVLVWPLERASSIKTMCSSIALMKDRKFATRSNREDRTLSVTRTR